MKKVFIVNGRAAYTKLFRSLGFIVSDLLHEADLVCFTGGEDVSPILYGDNPHMFTENNIYRDKDEQIIFDICLLEGIPMVGICRGGQFLNVMSGGRMYQHVQKHTDAHSITDVETGETVFASSTHHQMIMPSSEAVLVAFSTLHGEREWYDQEVFRTDISQQDIEAVYYPSTNCLCFQPHPEFIGYHALQLYFQQLITRYLNV